MHHVAAETCLFQRKVVVHEFNEENLCTHASLCGFCHVYVGLKKGGQTQDEKSLIWV